MTESAGDLFVTVRADLRGFARDLREKLDAETKKINAVVGVRVNAKGLRANLRTSVTTAAKGLHADVGMNVDNTGLTAKLRAATKEAVRDVKAEIPTKADGKGLRDSLKTEIGRTQRDAFGRPLKIKAEVDKSSLSGIANFAQKVRDVFAVGGALKIGALAVGIPAAIGAVNGLASALIALTAAAAPAAIGIGAALVPAIVGLVAAIGTVKLATSGVGDALGEVTAAQKIMAQGGKLSAAEQEKLAQALENLSPAAAKFVTTIGGLQGRFEELRRAVQERFFRNFVDDINQLANIYLPLLEQRLGTLSSILGSGVFNVGLALGDSRVSALVAQILDATNFATAGFASLTDDIVKAFVELAAAAIPVFNSFSNFFQNMIEDSTAFLIAEGRSGQLRETLIRAGETAEQVSRILFNFGAGIAGIFRAASASGEPLLDTLDRITGRFAEFTNSVAGSEQIASYFETAMTVLAPLGSLLKALGPALAQLSEPFAALVTAIANGLAPVIPVVATALGVFASAIASIAEPIGQVAASLGGVLVAAFQALAPILPPLAEALAKAAAELAGPLTEAIAQVAPFLPDLAQSVSELLIAVAPLAGELLALAVPLLQLAIAALPPVIDGLTILVNVLNFFSPLIKIVGYLVAALGGFFAIMAVIGLAASFPVAALVALGLALVVAYKRSETFRNVVNAAFGAVVGFLKTAGRFFMDVGRTIGSFFSDLGGAAGRAVSAVIGFFQGLQARVVSAVSGVGSAVAGFASRVGSAVLSFFQGLPGRITGALSSLGSAIARTASSAFNGMVSAVATAGTAVINFFIQLPGRVLSALLSLPGRLFAFWTTVLNAVLFAIGYAIGSYVRVFLTLGPRILGAIKAIPGLVVGVINSALTLSKNITMAGINAVVGFFTALPGRAAAAASRLWSAISSAFTTARANSDRITRAIVTAVVGFFTSLPGRVQAGLSSLGSRIASIFNSARAASDRITRSIVSSVVGFFSSLPGRAQSALSSLGSRVSSVFSSAANIARTKASELVSGFISFVSTLPSKAGSALSGVRSAVSGAFSGAATWLYSAGMDILRGLANGITGAIGTAVQAAKDAAGSVLSGVKSALGVNSPSRVFRDQVGKAIPEGMAVGILRNARLAMDAAGKLASGVTDKVQSDLEIRSPSRVFYRVGSLTIQGFINGLKKEFPNVSKTINSLTKNLPAQIMRRLGAGIRPGEVSDKIWDQLIGAGWRGRAGDRMEAIYSPVLLSLGIQARRLSALAAERVKTAQALKTANARLAEAQKVYADFAASVTQSTLQSAAITGLSSIDSIITRLTGKLSAAKDFAANITALVRRGLNKSLLQQIAEAGVEQAGGTAAALVKASDAQFKQVNSLQSELVTAAGKTGKAAADALYLAGVNAAKGLVAGLQSQQAQIALMMSRLALQMARALKNALGIRSPSQVFRDEIGVPITEGIAAGIKQAAPLMIAALNEQLTKLATGAGPVTIGVNGVVSGAGAAKSYTSPLTGLITGGSVTTPMPGGGSRTINVYPQPGQDEREIAAQVDRRLGAML